MKFRSSLVLGLVSFAFLSASPSFAKVHKYAAQFKVTVQNVTAGNRISPFFVITHKDNQRFFRVGSQASPGVQAIAERGDTSVLEESLTGFRGIFSTLRASDSAFAGGDRSATITVPVIGSKAPSVTLLAMIAGSNDTFVAVQDYDLSSLLGSQRSVSLFASNFDSGTEENTGNEEDFGSRGNPTEGAEGFISYDRGLNFDGNADQILAWGPKAARVTIERIR